MTVNLGRFNSVFDSIQKNATKQKLFMSEISDKTDDSVKVTRVGFESIGKLIGVVAVSIKNSNNILDSILNKHKENLEFEKEKSRDEARAAEKEKVKRVSEGKPEGSADEGFFKDLFDNMFSGLRETAVFDIVKAALIAPILFEFTKAFVNEITDGLFESLEFLDIPKIVAGFAFWKTLGTRLKPLFNSIARIFQPIANLSTSLTKFLAGPIGKTLSFFGSVSGITGILRLIGRLFKPIGVIFSAFDGMKAFIETEGTFLERLGAGIGEFFGSFIGTILDLIKDVTAWIVERLGFENAATIIRRFSFRTTIRSVIEGFFGLVSDAVEWVKLLFEDPTAALNSLWKTALGAYKSLLDIIFWPIDKAVQWISGLFGWEEGEDFSLTDLIWGAVGSAIEWVKLLFEDPTAALESMWQMLVGEDGLIGIIEGWGQSFIDWLVEFLPSIEDLSNALISKMPDWMRKLVGAPERTAEEIIEEQRQSTQSEIEDAQRRLESAPLADDQSRMGRLLGLETKEDVEEELRKLREREVELEIAAENPQKHFDLEELSNLMEQRDALITMVDNDRVGDHVRRVRNALIENEGWSRDIANEYVMRDSLEPIDLQIAELEARINSYNVGTKGFVDFGSGELAILHGKEAVVPMNTPAGQFLNNFFTDTWEPKILSAIETLGVSPNIETIMVPVLKQRFVANAAEQEAIQRSNAQNAIMNVMPQIVNSRPITNNASNTTIINNLSPARRTLDDPSMPL
jgi:hypothetical protein